MKTLKSPNKSKNLIGPVQKPTKNWLYSVAFVFVMTFTYVVPCKVAMYKSTRGPIGRM